jgi:hypothetical protein
MKVCSFEDKPEGSLFNIKTVKEAKLKENAEFCNSSTKKVRKT